MAESIFPALQPGAAALALLAGGALPLPFACEIVLLSTTVAGTRYRDLEAVEHELAAGEELTLCREPRNEHDALAIRVQRRDGTVLGYVPRRSNEVLARLMDAGKPILARLTERRREGDWLRLEIEIVLREV